MIGYLAQGLSLGFTAGTSPGPLQTFLVQMTLRHGWRRAIFGIFSPLLSDIPFILLALFVLRAFPPALIQIVQIVGGLFILYLAFVTARSLLRGESFTVRADGEDEDLPPRTMLWRTMLINWLSPGPYIFWATVNGPLLVEAVNESVLHGVFFMAGFYGAFLVLLAGWIIGFDRLGRIDPRFTRALLWVTVGVLLVFGLLLLADGVGLRG